MIGWATTHFFKYIISFFISYKDKRKWKKDKWKRAGERLWKKVLEIIMITEKHKMSREGILIES